MYTPLVAEIGANHNQSMQRCIQLIDSAKYCGFDSVKFQLYKLDKLFIRSVREHGQRLKMQKSWELPESFVPDLAAYCKEKPIGFSMSPYDIVNVQKVAPLVDYIKIPSYQLLWESLLIECARTHLPIVLSTGMASMNEINSAVETLLSHGAKFLTLLHSVTRYPVRPEDCNLAVMESLRKAFALPVGWSDHSHNSAVLVRAITHWDAELVECHFDLDGHGQEYVYGHCWKPEEICACITQIQHAQAADGKALCKPVALESIEAQWRADPVDGLRPLFDYRQQLVYNK